MPARSRCVIAYDISDDRRRTRLARLLLDYGDRLQHSVFEADLTPDDIERILRKARPLLDEDDSLRIYVLCAECVLRTRSLGREGPVGVADLDIV
jgi:CRISPR-associated protein Cas2